MPELAAEVFGQPVTRAAVESVRRAVKSLADRGVISTDTFPEAIKIPEARVERGEQYPHHRRQHHADRTQLFATRKLSVEARSRAGHSPDAH